MKDHFTGQHIKHAGMLGIKSILWSSILTDILLHIGGSAGQEKFDDLTNGYHSEGQYAIIK